jgi:hypothetical protein
MRQGEETMTKLVDVGPWAAFSVPIGPIGPPPVGKLVDVRFLLAFFCLPL